MAVFIKSLSSSQCALCCLHRTTQPRVLANFALTRWCTSVEGSQEGTAPPKPPKLLYVKRKERLTGTTYWQKDILKKLGIDFVHKREFTVVKNTPSMCNMLWKVKNLVVIKPVTFPHGEPDESDIPYTEVMPSGEMHVKKELKLCDTPVNPDVERWGYSYAWWIRTEKKFLWKT